jgi:Uma2 family endonuclease
MQAILPHTMQPLAVVSVRYPVQPNPDAWVIPEGPVPESTAHQAAVYRIYSLLAAWAGRLNGQRSLRIGQELAVRWLPEHPRTGIDPDVCVLEPAPPDFDDLSSLRLWEPNRAPPRLAIEVVSASHPYKDYSSIQERYAAMGVEELLIFDPLLVGPRSLGGPVALQLWRRDAGLTFERTHFSSQPVYSLVLDAWCIAEGRSLQLAFDRQGQTRWLTDSERLIEQQAEAERSRMEAERARAEAEQSRMDAERERLAREEVERRLTELQKLVTPR